MGSTERKIAVKQHDNVLLIPASEEKYFVSLGWEVTQTDEQKVAEQKAQSTEKARIRKEQVKANAALVEAAKAEHEAAVAEEQAALTAKREAEKAGGAFLDDIIGRADTGGLEDAKSEDDLIGGEAGDAEDPADEKTDPEAPEAPEKADQKVAKAPAKAPARKPAGQ